MNKTEFLTLPTHTQLERVEENGEIVIKFLQGTKNIYLYKFNNILVKVVSVNGHTSIDVINETEISRIFESNS